MKYLPRIRKIGNCQKWMLTDKNTIMIMQLYFMCIHAFKSEFALSLHTRISKSNQIIHYTRWITPKLVRSLRHCSRATQLLAKIYLSCDKVLATLCRISPGRNLNLRATASETNSLPLDQLAGLHELFFEQNYHWACCFYGSVSETIYFISVKTSCPNFQRRKPRQLKTLICRSWNSKSTWGAARS